MEKRWSWWNGSYGGGAVWKGGGRKKRVIEGW